MKAIFLGLLVVLTAMPEAGAQTSQETAYVAARERLVAGLEAKRKSLSQPIDESAWSREEARVHDKLMARLQEVMGASCRRPRSRSLALQDPDPVCCGPGAGTLDALVTASRTISSGR